MAPAIRHDRLLGVGLVLVGLLVAGLGLYLDSSAPPCDDTVESSEGPTVAAGGCQEPELSLPYGGVAVTFVGLVAAGSSHVLLWRRRT